MKMFLETHILKELLRHPSNLLFTPKNIILLIREIE